MISEGNWVNPDLVNKRIEIASIVTLPPQDLELNRRLLVADRVRYTLLGKPEGRPLLEHLRNTSTHLQTSRPYAISARLLAAAFVFSIEGHKLFGAATNALNMQAVIGTDISNRIFAHNFDIATGVAAGVNRLMIVEDELNGLTDRIVERNDQLARRAGFTLSAAESLEAYGVSIVYAKDSARLLSQDQSNTPGILLFEDLIDKVTAGQFVPGIIQESFPALTLLGLEDAMEVYRLVYPFSEKAIAENG